jgi:succinate dehydrogenase / fumarate reductase flavoprotein subunit
LETVVFGKIAGRSASRYVRDGGGSGRGVAAQRRLQEGVKAVESQIAGWESRDKGIPIHHLLQRMKVLMSDKVAIFRNRRDLQAALDGILEMRDDYSRIIRSGRNRRYSQEIVNIFEFEHSLELAEAISRGALRREETRGSHFRTDFPKRNDKDWLKHTIAVLRDGRVRLSDKKVRITKYKPEERKY